MIKTTKAFLITAALFALVPAANAVFLSIDPVSPTVDVGGTVDVNLNISGLGDFAPDSLGAFLVEITFDNALLDVAGVSYGALLGDTDPLAFETDILTQVSSGSVSLDLVSFLFDFQLDALQPSSFTLATLSFEGLAAGTSLLDFGVIDLSDAAFPASTLGIDGLQSGTLTVGNGPTPMPEPSTLWLVFVAVAGWFGATGKRWPI